MLEYADPYAVEGRWWKGNLHIHTTGSDGELPAQEVVHAYRAKGYDFIALTDHGVVTLATEEANGGPVVIPGFEFGHGQEHHLLCLGVTLTYGGSLCDVLNATRALGGVTIACHPNWLREDYWTPADMGALPHLVGLEVFNWVITRHPGRPIATDDWDALLLSGHLVWGFPNDDAHTADDIGRAWNMVRAPALSPEAMLSALRGGHSYCTTGLLFEDIGLHDSTIHVRLSGDGIIRFVGQSGEVLAESVGWEASLAPSGERYVRVEAKGALGHAWSQPFWRVRP